MITHTQHDGLSRPIADPELELDLRALIRLRTGQLEAAGDSARVVVVQGGDTPDIINAAVGFALTGDQAEPFSPDWIWDHGLWFEIACRAGSDEPIRIFVENGPGTELGIHYLCLSQAWAEGEERGHASSFDANYVLTDEFNLCSDCLAHRDRSSSNQNKE